MLKNLKSKISVTLSLIIMFLFSMTGTVFAKENTPSLRYNYVSLGDSLAAGQTPYGVTIGYGYTDIIADKLAGEGVLGTYSKYGKSGDTTEDLLTKLQNIQVINSIYHAQIVTIDIGANDFLKGETLQYLINNPDKAPSYIQGVAINIAKIIGTIQAINPNAKIYIMGYYNALPNLEPQKETLFLQFLAGFNNSIKKVVDGFKNTSTPPVYVNTYDSMDKHLEKYLPGDIHPTVQGYRSIAKDFWNLIKVDFLRGLE